jgi:hypothetical protein
MAGSPLTVCRAASREQRRGLSLIVKALHRVHDSEACQGFAMLASLDACRSANNPETSHGASEFAWPAWQPPSLVSFIFLQSSLGCRWRPPNPPQCSRRFQAVQSSGGLHSGQLLSGIFAWFLQSLLQSSFPTKIPGSSTLQPIIGLSPHSSTHPLVVSSHTLSGIIRPSTTTDRTPGSAALRQHSGSQVAPVT